MPSISFEEPAYGSQRDEAAFFYWLKRIPGVFAVTGSVRTLTVRIEGRRLSDEALREFLALFRRYRIEMRQLARFETTANRRWFRKRSAYWYRGVFG
jgi:hypothetical protein